MFVSRLFNVIIKSMRFLSCEMLVDDSQENKQYIWFPIDIDIL